MQCQTMARAFTFELVCRLVQWNPTHILFVYKCFKIIAVITLVIVVIVITFLNKT
jgi:hypothetical protein